jgi:hypothetical protein
MRVLTALLLLATPVAAADVPSGQQITLHEVLVDAQDAVTYLRFRFLAPQIAEGEAKIDFVTSGEDMMHLCQTLVLPYLDEYALEGDRIVISFMDRITEFGVPDPDAVQYFESFSTQDDVCIWDEF